MARDRTGDLFSALNKTFGGVVGTADKKPMDNARITTGSTELDALLGGGIKVGRVTLFWGERAGGKTTSAFRIIGISQNLCRRCLRPAIDVQSVPPDEDSTTGRWTATGRCDCYAKGLTEAGRIDPPPKEKGEKEKDYKARVEAFYETMRENSYEEFVVAYLDPENAFDKAWAVQLGVDVRRLIYALPNIAEEAVDISTSVAASTVVDLMVVDSLANFTPRKEYEESAEEWQQGLQARIVNKAVRKWITGSCINQNAGQNLTQIWINQTRLKIGITYGDPSVKPGGLGQDFAGISEIRFTGSKVLKDDKATEQYGDAKTDSIVVPLRETFFFEVAKTKASTCRSMKGSYMMALREVDGYKPGDIVEDEFLFKWAMHLLVEKRKDGYTIGGRVYSTQNAVQKAIREDQDLRATIRDVVIRHYQTTTGGGFSG